MAKPEMNLGFRLNLATSPAFTLTELRDLCRGIEDYAERNELEISGTHFQYAVRGRDRGLVAEDQVALMDALIDLPGVCGVRVGALVEDPDDEGPDDAYIEAAIGSLAVIALTMLHRLGRVTAEQYLQILGGFVRSAVH